MTVCRCKFVRISWPNGESALLRSLSSAAHALKGIFMVDLPREGGGGGSGKGVHDAGKEQS